MFDLRAILTNCRLYLYNNDHVTLMRYLALIFFLKELLISLEVPKFPIGEIFPC